MCVTKGRGVCRRFWLNAMAGSRGPISIVSCALVRPVAVGATTLALMLVARDARAGEEQELDSARVRLEGGQPADAAARLSRMLDPNGAPCKSGPDVSPQGCRVTDPDIIERSRGYYAIALVALDREPDAKAQIDAMLEQNPSFRPNPATFPPKVMDLIIGEQARLSERLARIAAEKAAKEQADRDSATKQSKAQADYVKALEAAASKETVVETHSRWIAAIPFGVGQFQNDNVGLGVLFASVEGAATVSTIVTAVLATDLRNKAIAQQNPDPNAPTTAATTQKVETAKTNSQIGALTIANNVSLAVLGVMAISGIIEAEVSFKPTVTTSRARPLPPKPKVTLTGVPGAPDATGVGLQIKF